MTPRRVIIKSIRWTERNKCFDLLDNIMYIEPGILLMFNAMRVGVSSVAGLPNNVSLTSMLFDFLCRIGTNYFLPYKEQILNGIMQSFKDGCDKKVIPSLQIFFVPQIDPKTQLSQPPPVDRDLRALVQATFGTFFQTLNLNQPSLAAAKTPTMPDPPSTIPSPTPSPLVNIGSTTSLFKQKSTGIDDGLPPISLKSSIDLLGSSIKSETTFSPLVPDQFKSEPDMPPAIRITTDNNISATFSDDEEDQEASNHSEIPFEEKKPTLVVKSNTPNQLLVVNPSPSPLVSSIQAQLQQFVTKPFKVYTSIDDTQTMLTSLNAGSVSSLAQSANSLLENSLNLIGILLSLKF